MVMWISTVVKSANEFIKYLIDIPQYIANILQYETFKKKEIWTTLRFPGRDCFRQ